MDDGTKSGCIQTALSTVMAGENDRLRGALRKVTSQRLQWPPHRTFFHPDARSYFNRMLQTFVFDSDKGAMHASQQIKVMLMSVPWGDVRQRGIVEVLALPPFDS